MRAKEAHTSLKACILVERPIDLGGAFSGPNLLSDLLEVQIIVVDRADVVIELQELLLLDNLIFQTVVIGLKKSTRIHQK